MVVEGTPVNLHALTSKFYRAYRDLEVHDWHYPQKFSNRGPRNKCRSVVEKMPKEPKKVWEAHKIEGSIKSSCPLTGSSVDQWDYTSIHCKALSAFITRPNGR